MKKVVVAVLLMAIIATCAFMFVACDDEEQPQSPQTTQNNDGDDDADKIETDLSVDLQSDVGLYFLDENAEYVRYSKNLDSRYFDKNKPTIVFFHGWVTHEVGKGEIYFPRIRCAEVGLSKVTTFACLTMQDMQKTLKRCLKKFG